MFIDVFLSPREISSAVLLLPVGGAGWLEVTVLAYHKVQRMMLKMF